jgi:hypothetical protein
MANCNLPFLDFRAMDRPGKMENTEPAEASNTFFLIQDLREYLVIFE